MATLTVYPNADPESTSVDGYVNHIEGGVAFGTLVAGAGTGASDTTAENEIVLIDSGINSNTWDEIWRSIFLFDTSPLTASATISAATMSIMGTYKFDTFATDINLNINIYTSAPASNTALVAGDYDSLGTTAQSDTAITYANWLTTPAYNDFVLNATGLGNISKTAVTKFGARNANYDVANSAPTWEESKQARLGGNYSDAAGTSSDPKLVITYTLPAVAGGGASNLLTLNVG